MSWPIRRATRSWSDPARGRCGGRGWPTRTCRERTHRETRRPDPLRIALGLTPREAEVLLWTAQGKTNIEIGTILGMSDLTVKQHLGHVFEKLGVEGRNPATLRALEVLSTPARKKL